MEYQVNQLIRMKTLNGAEGMDTALQQPYTTWLTHVTSPELRAPAHHRILTFFQNSERDLSFTIWGKVFIFFFFYYFCFSKHSVTLAEEETDITEDWWLLATEYLQGHWGMQALPETAFSFSLSLSPSGRWPSPDLKGWEAS